MPNAIINPTTVLGKVKPKYVRWASDYNYQLFFDRYGDKYRYYDMVVEFAKTQLQFKEEAVMHRHPVIMGTDGYFTYDKNIVVPYTEREAEKLKLNGKLYSLSDVTSFREELLDIFDLIVG